MKAYLDKIFDKGFLLSEETVIKLDDIIHKRLREHGIGSDLSYKIYRADSLVFETADHRQLLAEENSARNAIDRIEVGCKADDLRFSLEFDRKKKTHLLIEAEDKDLAYLLFSDIKNYMSAEVLKFRSFRFSELKIDRFLFPIMMLVIMFATAYLSKQGQLDDKGFRKLVGDHDLDAKINYLLVEGRERSSSNKLWYLTIGVIGISLASAFAFDSLDKMFPVNIFYLGKEVPRMDRMREIRSRIVWGVGIALLVSVIGSYIVFYLTTK